MSEQKRARLVRTDGCMPPRATMPVTTPALRTLRPATGGNLQSAKLVANRRSFRTTAREFGVHLSAVARVLNLRKPRR